SGRRQRRPIGRRRQRGPRAARGRAGWSGACADCRQGACAGRRRGPCCAGSSFTIDGMTQDPTRTLLLIDGSSYLYRAYHAMPDLRAVPGDPTSPATGAIRGMINMIQSLKKEVPALYAACVFDASGPTFRDAIYAEYKA